MSYIDLLFIPDAVMGAVFLLGLFVVKARSRQTNKES